MASAVAAACAVGGMAMRYWPGRVALASSGASSVTTTTPGARTRRLITVVACTRAWRSAVAIFTAYFLQILRKISGNRCTPLLPEPLYCIESVNNRGKEGPQMAGLIVFKSLADALREGYQVYDRTADGYLVRTRTAAGWAMALVSCK